MRASAALHEAEALSEPRSSIIFGATRSSLRQTSARLHTKKSGHNCSQL